ncbi:MAG: hypothetical protein NTW97_04970 [Candidatus Krumholzibacteria bacterium]|nr:hypothetical protein [Candidatus Krumholzibacteria bacterium]
MSDILSELGIEIIKHNVGEGGSAYVHKGRGHGGPQTVLCLVPDGGRSFISRHLYNVFKTVELDRKAAVAFFAAAQIVRDSVCAFFAHTTANRQAHQVKQNYLDASIITFMIAESDSAEKDAVVNLTMSLIGGIA